MTPLQLERAAYIAEMERKMEMDRLKFAEAKARYEATQAALNLAMQIYIDALTAPMRAFAEELRRG